MHSSFHHPLGFSAVPSIALMLLTGFPLTCEDASGQTGTIAPPPPTALFSGYEPSWQEGSSLQATVRHETLEKEVVFTWIEPVTRKQSTDTVATSYYPTAVLNLPLAPPRVAVAGRTKLGGRTVIEVFSYTPPIVGTDISGNVTIGPMNVYDISVVYSEATPGRDLVDHMRPSLFHPEVLVLQFWDSKDLYSLRLLDSQLTRLATPVAGAGVLQVPELATLTDPDLFWMGEHDTDGYLYVLAEALVNQNDTLVIIDSDKDMVLDSYVVISSSQWATSGYHDATNFTQFR